MRVWLKINSENIADGSFKTDGCGNAIAPCGMATEMCKGKTTIEP